MRQKKADCMDRWGALGRCVYGFWGEVAIVPPEAHMARLSVGWFQHLAGLGWCGCASGALYRALGAARRGRALFLRLLFDLRLRGAVLQCLPGDAQQCGSSVLHLVE